MIPILTTFKKKKKKFIPNHIGEIKTFNFSKNGLIL
jgi:hypothetical protein